MEMKVLFALVLLVAAASASEYCKKKRQKVWILAGGGDYGTEDIILENDGSLCGWGRAVVLAACQAAGIHCKIVFTPYDHCLMQNQPTFNTHVRLGRSLQLRSVHGCYGWWPTRERRDVVSFTDGYMEDQPYRLFYKANTRPRSSRSDLRVAFTNGVADEFCLRRLLERSGVTLRDFSRQVTYEARASDAFARQGNTYDLVFYNWREAALFGNVNMDDLREYDINNNGNSNDDTIFCAEGAGGVMTRVDELELIEAFNYGLRVIRDNGVYEGICNNPDFDATATRTAAHRPWCIRDGN